MIFEVVKFDIDGSNDNCEICFSNEESAIEFIGKYLNGLGCVRPREYTKQHKVFKSLEEYEDYISNELE